MLKGSSLLQSLEYGPAPENDSGAKEWIESHNGRFGLFINNEWVHPEGREYTETINPATNEPLAEVIEGDVPDVDLAVECAKNAFETWSQLTGHQRAKHIYAIARHMAKHKRLLAILETLDNGKTIRETRDVDVPLCIRHFYYHAGWAQLMETELKEYKPVGVIAQVIPWNFPLLMLAWKIAPAIAMGNTVVLKPAPSTRLTAMLFAEIVAAAGVPPGVINIVPGGNDFGYALINHPDVDKVAFTGSTKVGKLLRESTAGTGKKLSLELGGKSPFVVFDDADLDSAVEGVVNAIWFNQGQVCCAGSRCLVQESVADRFINKIKRKLDTLRTGNPLDKCMDMGAIVNPNQLERIKYYVSLAEEEGASVYQSKFNIPENGLFYPPTLIYDVETSSKCVVDEIFGPVLTLMTFRTPSEAVALANNTAFGLAGSVWSESISTALDIAFQIKAGVIWINSHNLFDAAAGFGGYKESGYGREAGKEGLYEYTKLKWKDSIKNSFTDEEKAAPWGGASLPCPPKIGEFSIKNVSKVDRTTKLYIDGKQCRPDQDHSYIVMNSNNEKIGEAGWANRKDIRNAVEAAHKAAPGWGKRAAYNRSQILYYVAENLDARFDEFAERIQAQTCCDLEAAKEEVQLSIERLFYWAAFSDKFGGSVQETPKYGATVCITEAIGVIGITCPNEYPLLGFVSLFAPAIVRGNTIVIIPSETAPLSATDLYQVFECSDIPAGVVNIVTGVRDSLTKVLVEHMDVNAHWYFGSAIGSYHVENLSSCNLKRTFVNYGKDYDWKDITKSAGIEFLYNSVQYKNIWAPAGV
eukprot:TRINITY_DN929_c0_g3_i1.p1 TRINITY_DN929_c0_g3~~TRINITY_DN929_c0_g3_i1.p1  ORF type:complete len:809 (-),score=349.57 TRINITY_DN929_c0_g3_i1:28-2454(-)